MKIETNQILELRDTFWNIFIPDLQSIEIFQLLQLANGIWQPLYGALSLNPMLAGT
jgi:hypothetical protein